jgi:hypothetical protein
MKNPIKTRDRQELFIEVRKETINILSSCFNNNLKQVKNNEIDKNKDIKRYKIP